MIGKGIDVSKYQKKIDWEKVKQDGVVFAIIRAGHGRELSQKDPYFEQNYDGARAAGIKVGVYWYSYAVDAQDAAKEAAVCLQVLGDRTLDLPVYYDVEEQSQADKGKQFVTELILTFTKVIKQAGRQAGVYANTNWFTNYIDRSKLGDLSIWKADYRQNYDKAIPCVDFGEVQEVVAQPTPAPTFACDVFYRVRTKAHGWLSEVKNLTDYAGWKESPVTDVAVKVSAGAVKYRVHVKGGSWLPYVTGYDVNDSKKGYAGNGKPIDAVEITYTMPDGVTPLKKAKYRVAPTGKDYYSWQYNNEKANGQDGYAGLFGKEIGKLQIVIE